MKSVSKLFFLFAAAAVFFPAKLDAAETANTFRPAWWCRGAHAQTIGGALWRADAEVTYERERLDTPDGDFLDLDWLKADGRAPLVVVLHGLGSSSDSNYVRTMMEEVSNRGWQAVAVNARGSTGPNRLTQSDHSGKTEDLDWVIKKIIERGITDEIYLVGFSAGGNKVVKWLGENGDEVPVQVKKAAAVSGAYDLAEAVENLDQGFNRRMYTGRMLKGLKKQVFAKREKVSGVIDLKKAEEAETFAVYDAVVTAPMNGFKDERDFWARASAAPVLAAVQRPVLMIHARNDSFLPEEDLPLETIRQSKYLKLMLTPDGGHLGFVSGKVPFRLDRWLEKTTLDFLQAKEPEAAADQESWPHGFANFMTSQDQARQSAEDERIKSSILPDESSLE